MESIQTGKIGNSYTEGDELINNPSKEMLHAILSAAKAHKKHADHCLISGASSGLAVLIIKGHLHDIAARVLCETLALYDCNSFELGELIEGNKDQLKYGSEYERFFNIAKTIIKFANLPDDEGELINR
ncbi:hypothetical protein [Providencia rettgeri]|uniref:hypothetical protein n=1 Tax=Providencia rettgeri TaxID=587 RepID=UPI001B35B7F1|nr:hypothetical protein [Providencia rettgeri]MBQ0438416.1 hypothetical protein [Providencia rettgeri]